MWHLISMALVLLVTALPAPARGQANQCGDVNSDGAVNFVDARLILLGQMPPCPVCGNGVIDPGEDCDVGDLGGATCETYELPFGQIDCNPGCTHDLSGCHAQRYQDNGDGTITDWKTGLMWEKKENLDSAEDLNNPHDADNWYTWTDLGDGDQIDPDGTAFLDFLVELNNCVDDGTWPPTGVIGGFAGHCDWRLPTILELQSIVDPNAPGCPVGSPCIDPIFAPTASLGYWSSTTDASDPRDAWGVGFDGGYVSGYDKGIDGHVRAVRGGR